MKTESLERSNGLDRIATADEIRIALALFEDLDGSEDEAEAMELPSDLGGYVRIPTEELEFLSLLDDVDTHSDDPK